MPRPLLLHVPNAFYHGSLRGNHRQAIFFRPADRRLLESIVEEVIERFQARVHAYCWMTNHIHSLLRYMHQNLLRARMVTPLPAYC